MGQLPTHVEANFLAPARQAQHGQWLAVPRKSWTLALESRRVGILPASYLLLVMDDPSVRRFSCRSPDGDPPPSPWARRKHLISSTRRRTAARTGKLDGKHQKHPRRHAGGRGWSQRKVHSRVAWPYGARGGRCVTRCRAGFNQSCSEVSTTVYLSKIVS